MCQRQIIRKTVINRPAPAAAKHRGPGLTQTRLNHVYQIWKYCQGRLLWIVAFNLNLLDGIGGVIMSKTILKPMSREQFQRQFDTEIEYTDELANILQLDGVILNTPVYRAMEKLVIVKDNGKYYCHL